MSLTGVNGYQIQKATISAKAMQKNIYISLTAGKIHIVSRYDLNSEMI